jgi:hypothetical protein
MKNGTYLALGTVGMLSVPGILRWVNWAKDVRIRPPASPRRASRRFVDGGLVEDEYRVVSAIPRYIREEPGPYHPADGSGRRAIGVEIVEVVLGGNAASLLSEDAKLRAKEAAGRGTRGTPFSPTSVRQVGEVYVHPRLGIDVARFEVT